MVARTPPTLSISRVDAGVASAVLEAGCMSGPESSQDWIKPGHLGCQKEQNPCLLSDPSAMLGRHPPKQILPLPGAA